MVGNIEPGCLAIVINSEAGSDGTCVTVMKYIGFAEDYLCDDNWLVDTPLRWVIPADSVYAEEEGWDYYCSESKLLRIDDFQGDKANEVIKIKQKRAIQEPIQVPS